MATARSVSQEINVGPAFNTLEKAALLRSFRSEFGQVKALANTTVNASTVLVTDAEFSFQVKKGHKYFVKGEFLISTGATPGIKLQLTAPASTTSATTFVGKSSATQGTANVDGVTLAYNTGLNTPLFSSAVAYDFIGVQGIYIPEADDVLTVQFAQNTSDASDTILLLGSRLICTEIRNNGSAPSSI